MTVTDDIMARTKLAISLCCDLMLRHTAYVMDLDFITNVHAVASASGGDTPPNWLEYLDCISACRHEPGVKPERLVMRCSADDPAPPPRPLRFERSLFTPTVVALLRSLCGGRADACPHSILADALAGAGMVDQAIDDHLRREHHAPSCWAIFALINEIPDDSDQYEDDHVDQDREVES